jgi:hypothetical protein
MKKEKRRRKRKEEGKNKRAMNPRTVIPDEAACGRARGSIKLLKHRKIFVMR